MVNTLVQVVGKAVAVGVGLITTGMLTRRLGADIYGGFILISSLFVFLDSMADFGTKIIGVREASGVEGWERESKWVQVGWLRLFLSGVSFLLGLVVVNSWGGFALMRKEAILGLTMIFFTSIAGSIEIIWQTKMRMELKVIIESSFPLLFLMLLWFGDGRVTLWLVFVFLLVARVVSLGLGLLAIKLLGVIKTIGKIDKTEVRRLLKESWPMGVYLLVFASYDRAVDSLMIERLAGIREVAWYGLAYKIYATLLQPVYFYVSSIFPLMSSKLTDKKKLMSYSKLIIGGSLLVGLPLAYWLSPWVVEVLAGSEFLPSVAIFRILLLAMSFSYLNHLWGFNLIAKKGQSQMLQVGLIALVTNVGLNLIIIPRFGIIGAAWVTVATEAISFLGVRWFLARVA